MKRKFKLLTRNQSEAVKLALEESIRPLIALLSPTRPCKHVTYLEYILTCMVRMMKDRIHFWMSGIRALASRRATTLRTLPIDPFLSAEYPGAIFLGFSTKILETRRFTFVYVHINPICSNWLKNMTRPQVRHKYKLAGNNYSNWWLFPYP
jgi:hypothetical protein